VRLAEEGRLSLHDPITKFFDVSLPEPYDRITVHNLLSHSSGFSTIASAEARLSKRIGIGGNVGGVSESREMQGLFDDLMDWAVGKPGERFSYLNEGFGMLGNIISIASGVDYGQYVIENILKPLGMSSTFFYGGGELNVGVDVATPYRMDGNRGPVESPLPAGTSASGSLYSTVDDLSKYLGMFLSRGKADGVRIVSESGIAKMETPHIRLEGSLFGEEGYGYGLNIASNFFGHKVISHSGSVFVYTSHFAYLPDAGIKLSVLSNATGFPPAEIAHYALALALSIDPEKIPYVGRNLILKSLQGKYGSFQNIIVNEITTRGDFLELRNNYGDESVILVPESITASHAEFRTVRNGRETISEFFLHQDGKIELIHAGGKFRKFA
jgi:CubicO group peptidase (beta-lactamase class C family)